MMRSAMLLTMTTVALLAPAAHAQEAARGAWQRGDGVARVKVAPCGKALCMTNTWIKPGSSEKVGEYIVLTLKPAGQNRWKGSGHDPQRGANFSADMKLSGNHMTTSGCIAGGVICRSTEWTRIR